MATETNMSILMQIFSVCAVTFPPSKKYISQFYFHFSHLLDLQ